MDRWDEALSTGSIRRQETTKAAQFAGLSHEAGDGGRTRDLWLGKPTLYQLSYTRAGPESTDLAPERGVIRRAAVGPPGVVPLYPVGRDLRRRRRRPRA